MSEASFRQQQQQAQAIAKLLELILPQGFSSNEVMASGEHGRIDEWKMTKFSGRAMMTLLYLRHRGENDGIRFYKEFTDYFIRGSHSIDGTSLKMLENVAIGITGGSSRGKVIKKPGIIGRFRDKDWRRKAEADGSTIVE